MLNSSSLKDHHITEVGKSIPYGEQQPIGKFYSFDEKLMVQETDGRNSLLPENEEF